MASKGFSWPPVLIEHLTPWYTGAGLATIIEVPSQAAIEHIADVPWDVSQGQFWPRCRQGQFSANGSLKISKLPEDLKRSSVSSGSGVRIRQKGKLPFATYQG
jgi:hypothetical protein